VGGLGMTPKELLQVVRRRKLLILLTWGIVLGSVAGFTVLWRLKWPWYTAEALLRVEPAQTELLMVRTLQYDKAAIERWKRDQAAMVRHQTFLQEAVKDSRITETAWYRDNKDRIIKKLADAIDVSPISETSLVKISMTGTNKNELPNIVNAVVDQFVLHASRGTRDTIGDEINKLVRERGDLVKDRDDYVRRLEVARAGSLQDGMPERQGRIAIMVRALAPQVAEAEIAQRQAQAALDAHAEDIRTGMVARSPEVMRAMELDPELRSLQLQSTELQTRLSNAVQRMGGQHRTVQSLKSMIQALKEQIKERSKVVIDNTRDAITQMRQQALAAATNQRTELATQLEKVQKEGRDLEAALAEIENLKKAQMAAEEKMAVFEKRIMEKRAALRGEAGKEGELGPVTVGAHAVIPPEPSAPRWKVMLPAGAFVGLLLGLGLAFLLEVADTSIKSPGDVLRKVDLPLLGMVPHSDDLDEDIDDFRRVAITAPHSPAAEAFRQIRANLLFSGPAERRRSLLVTSPAPEDGRTTVVLNLATSMAQAGRRVLVVDANFRQPAIAGMYPQAAAAGLSSALVGQTSWRDAVSPMDVPNCDVITSGPLPPNPAELLGSEMMRKIISEMTAEYDQVIFDGSPVMVVSDACVLATQVDGVVLVVRAGSNSVGIVQRAAEHLARVGAHVLGVVLQGVRTTAGGYLRKNYQTFYEYHQKSLP